MTSKQLAEIEQEAKLGCNCHEALKAEYGEGLCYFHQATGELLTAFREMQHERELERLKQELKMVTVMHMVDSLIYAVRRAVTLGVLNPEWFTDIADRGVQALAAWEEGKKI